MQEILGVKIGTIVEISKIGYLKWAIATHRVANNPKGISSMQLHRDLVIRQSSALFLLALVLHRLRETWHTLTNSDLMSVSVEVDEVYLDGQEKNKHANNKGNTKKTAVVGGIKDGDTGTIVTTPVPETAAAHLTLHRIQYCQRCQGVFRRE